jgi:predicted nucleic acid-binding protein
MMKWRPKGYEFDTKNLVRALFSEHTDEGKLLEAAACGYVEIFARSSAWNGVLWLIMNTLKQGNFENLYQSFGGNFSRVNWFLN